MVTSASGWNRMCTVPSMGEQRALSCMGWTWEGGTNYTIIASHHDDTGIVDAQFEFTPGYLTSRLDRFWERLTKDEASMVLRLLIGADEESQMKNLREWKTIQQLRAFCHSPR